MLTRLKHFVEYYRDMLFDKELRAISAIINAKPDDAQPYTATMEECDRIFSGRMASNRESYRMSFWQDHFEWKYVVQCPEIKGRLLDIGCGSGHADIYLARSGLSVHGIDMSPVAIRIATYLKSWEPAEVASRLSFGLADITRDAVPVEKFDCAWACHVFEHIPDPAGLLKGLTNWLRPGGKLLISVPLGYAHDNSGHIHHFHSAEELKRYLGDHLTVTRIESDSRHGVIRALGSID